MSRQLLKAEYAVRGVIVVRANEIKQELLDGNPNKLPFDHVIMCNIGNPQALGQIPLTFIRQVLAGCLYPQLLEMHASSFPRDVHKRVHKILNGTAHRTMGAYTHSQGISTIRESVANFITQRFAPCVFARLSFSFEKNAF